MLDFALALNCVPPLRMDDLELMCEIPKKCETGSKNRGEEIHFRDNLMPIMAI